MYSCLDGQELSVSVCVVVCVPVYVLNECM